MCGSLVVVVAFVCIELCCVMLCAPALSLAILFLYTNLFFFEACCCVFLAVLRD